MEKVLESIRTKKATHYVIIAIIGLLVSIPLIWLQLRGTDDGWLHLLRLIGIDNSVKTTSFPFLIQPFYCNDWGYSMLAFYPTIVSYIPYFLGKIVGSFTIGIKIFASLTIILSGFSMYKFLLEVTKKKEIALISAIIYMVLPYRLEDIYNRFAIGEFTAFVFIPLVFLGLYNLLNGDKSKSYFITIGAVGLMLSHTISTIYTALFCLIYVLLNLKKFLKKEVIIKCIINVIFILLISALFWIPMLEFKTSAEYAIFEPDALKTSGKYVAKNTIEIWQLVKDKGEENGVSFVIGIPFITMLLLGIFTYKKLDKEQKKFYMTGILFGLICFFMCTKYFPWKLMPNFLCTIQYPWRLVGFAIFFLTPLCGINIYYILKDIKNKNLKIIIYILIIVILGLFTIKKLETYKNENGYLDKEYEQTIIESPRIHYFSVNRDYMPLKALVKQRDYLLIRTNETYVLGGNANIVNEYKNGLYMEISIKEAEKGTELELPYLYYPGYEIILTEKENTLNIETTESENGFVKITIPKSINNAKITVQYKGTYLEKTAYIISGISLIAFIIYKRKTALT